MLFSLSSVGRRTLEQSPSVQWHVSGDENASCTPALPEIGRETRVMERYRSKQSAGPLDLRLEEQAKRLRKEARGTPPGVEREKPIRLARQAETAAHIQEWLTSPGLQAPR
jgi:hypothetical protein